MKSCDLYVIRDVKVQYLYISNYNLRNKNDYSSIYNLVFSIFNVNNIKYFTKDQANLVLNEYNDLEYGLNLEMIQSDIAIVINT